MSGPDKLDAVQHTFVESYKSIGLHVAVMLCDVIVLQTAQAHQQVVEKQVSATLAQLSHEGNSHSITSSLSLALWLYF